MARLLCTLTLAALAIAGCGGSNDDDGGPGRTVKVAANGAVTVRAKEYSFDPKTIVVDGAGRLRIRLDNDRSLAPDVRVRQGGRGPRRTPPPPARRERAGHGQPPPRPLRVPLHRRRPCRARHARQPRRQVTTPSRRLAKR